MFATGVLNLFHKVSYKSFSVLRPDKSSRLLPGVKNTQQNSTKKSFSDEKHRGK